jgi:hypothetical protein
MRRSRRSSVASSVVWTVLACTALSYSSYSNKIWAAAAAAKDSTDKSPSKVLGTRQGNLDYMDASTVKYYLSPDTREDYNVAILFYAQWCRNCHALAPTWDMIGQHLSAGTEKSKLVLGLFDCEADYDHMEVCTEAGVTHYPTLQYYSLSGQQYRKFPAKKKGDPPQPKHTNVFGGNWQYADAVLDWLTVNQALSSWHRAGWGKRLRRLLSGGKFSDGGDGSAKQGLPIGVPGDGRGSSSGSSVSKSGSTSTGSSSASTAGSASTNAAGADTTAASSKLLDAKVQELEKKSEELYDIATRSTIVVDSLLFPLAMEGPDEATLAIAMTTDTAAASSYTDLYRYLNVTDGWTAKDDPQKEIIRACVMEVGLDYCGRLATHQATTWISTFADIDDITDDDVETFQKSQSQLMEDAEPYCAVLEDCIVTEFQNTEVCRPPTCPFHDVVACRYLTACLTEQLQTEFAIAMGFLDDGSGKAGASSSSAGTAGAAASASTGASSTDPAGAGWGVA